MIEIKDNGIENDINNQKDNNTVKDNGYSSNKDVLIKRIKGITIEKFRTIENKNIKLGENITLISGRNGTMKTSILGLIAHPFTGDAKDIFGQPLKTSLKDVFKLSLEKDDKYKYYMNLETNTGKHIEEPIRIYQSKIKIDEPEKRYRIVVGKDNSGGSGNFSLNTSYINFKRLFPIVDTDASEYSNEENFSLSKLNEFISKSYGRILLTESFQKNIPVSESKQKNKFTVGPIDTYYDFNSISSGEDNLGHILLKMYAFMENVNDNNKDCLQGILCIDEIEAGLHPSAQESFFDFLFDWSKKYNVQIVATTHSLYLMQYAIELQSKTHDNKNRIQINIISKAQVKDRNYNIISNPKYNQTYKELTYKEITQIEDTYKIPILCEDNEAKEYLRKIFTQRAITSKLDIMHGITDDDSNQGTSYKSLFKLISNGEKLFLDTIFIFDSDVDITKIKSRKIKKILLPSKHKMPLEKEIIKYIFDADETHAIFNEKEKDAYKQDFVNCKIDLTALSDIEEIKKCKTNNFKKWSDKNKEDFKKITRLYIAENKEIMLEFKEEFLTIVNELLERKSLPSFDIEKFIK